MSEETALIKFSLRDTMKFCLHCNTELKQRETESYRDFNKRVFCNRVCSNNHILRGVREPKIQTCELCSRDLPVSKYKRKYCSYCLPLVRASISSKSGRLETFSNKTKGEVFLTRANYQSARSGIRKHANDVYFSSGKEQKCIVCGYSKYIEVCHIKSVSSFPDEALLSEINAKDNLVALCPNHHWEFDSGLLVL